ncbi:MAG: non-homologous end-joining DNA ligase [Pseudomonadota bacterium]
MGLEKYWSKRNFARTPEPQGEVAPAAERLRFVIQKHAASHLHYDFRLELEGTLKSWAIPKGPSLDPQEKRLAVEVEDHPLDYGSFEGKIPEGEYGGGTVLLWDRGSWTPEGDPAEGYRRGRLKFRLDGEKLEGQWALVRMASRDGKRRNWLLVKSDDEFAREGDAAGITERRGESVLTGRALEEIEAGKPARRRRAAPAAVVAGVTLTHPSRLVYPAAGLTKLDVARYYEAVAAWLLPELKDRPLTLLRCPQGLQADCFIQRHLREPLPASLRAVAVPGGKGGAPYMTAGSLTAVLDLVQRGVLELHTWGARRDRLDRPDRMIFDLDPAPDVAWRDFVAYAQLLRALLQEFGLPAFLKTTGGKGVHVEVPLRREHAWEAVKAFSQGIAQLLAQRLPDCFVATAAKRARHGRVFVDYLRNAAGATAVAAYSTRARTGAPVALPLGWDELPDTPPGSWTLRNVPARLAEQAQSPWRDYEKSRAVLGKALFEKLGREAPAP